jgi:hypothetical protein
MFVGPNIIRDNLSLVLDATSNRSWTAGSSTWYDLSGNNNNASASGSPSTQDDGTGVRSIAFDGTNDRFIVTANETSLSFKNGQTVGILMYHTFDSGRRNPWNQAYGGYGTWTHEQGANINHYHGTHGGNAPPYVSRNSDTTPRSTWNYMVMSRDTSNVTWYKNGIQTSQSSSYGVLTNTTTANITIGQGYAGWWVGNIVFVHAYTRGLTAIEVQQNYNAHKNRFNL